MIYYILKKYQAIGIYFKYTLPSKYIELDKILEEKLDNEIRN